MRLLIFTQKVDSLDPVLGFFHAWIKEFATNYESVEVICLEKGEFDLPRNVTVYSLGKEKGASSLQCLRNFYHYLFLIRNSYDKVFVHMNQEYVLLAGLYWKIKKVSVYLWRNHPLGNIFTRTAVLLSTKVFCTSPNSFTANFRKTIIMPVGYDNAIFKMTEGVVRKKYSVLILGRISPIKHIDLAVKAASHLVQSGFQISLNIVGPVPNRDIVYLESLKKMVVKLELSTCVTFGDEVTRIEAPEVFSGHEICLNLTDSFDKTIVEAAACGAIPLVSNKALSRFLPKVCVTNSSPESIALSLQQLLEAHVQTRIQSELRSFVESQSLSSLMKKLSVEMQ